MKAFKKQLLHNIVLYQNALVMFMKQNKLLLKDLMYFINLFIMYFLIK